jgi:hypothetical protein
MPTEPLARDDKLFHDMVDERLAFVEPLEERIGIPKGTMGPCSARRTTGRHRQVGGHP